jgi:NitT/TauT family transport system substrate-binding protein
MTRHPRNIWRVSIAALAAFTLGLALTACGSDGGSEGSSDATLRVSVQPTTTALPVAVADKKGFFEKRGLDVEWKASGVQISDSIATLGKQVDITMGTQPALISASSQGVPVVAITGGAVDLKDRPTSEIIARKGSGITTYADLEGKKIGTLTLTGNIHFSLMKSLKDAGVDLDSIQWVATTVPTAPDMLKSGRVDAIEEILPFSTQAVNAGGVSLGDPFRSVSDKEYVGLWLSNRDWANKNEDTILKFNEALDEAQQWLEDKANEAEAKEIQGSYTGLSGAALQNTPIPAFEFSTSGTQLKEALGDSLGVWVQIMKDTSDFDADVDSADLLPEWAK